MSKCYDLYCNLPDRSHPIRICKQVQMHEIQRVTSILVRVTTELHKIAPVQENNRWLIQSYEWQENHSVLCWWEEHRN